MPRLDGSTHVSLTVTDIDRSTQWYGRVFGFVVLGEVTSPEFRFRTLLHERSFASLALAQPLDVRDRAFDEGRVGLHHLAYHVPERADLVDWSRHLDSLEVAHSGVLKPEWELGAQIWLRDPDGIQLEIYWVNRDLVVGRLRAAWRSKRSELV